MIRRLALPAAALFLLAGLAAAADPVRKPPTTSNQPVAGAFVHTVIFHLKKDAPAGTADKVVADCHALLETIPTVKGVKAGRPAPEDESTPKVSVRDYDVALVVLFDDAAGLKTYLNHETHLKFVHTYEQYFDKVEVYDFADAQKK